MRLLRALLQFLMPGFGVKRWLSLALPGLLILGMGIGLLRRGEGVDILRIPNRILTLIAARSGIPLWTDAGPFVLIAGLVFTGIGTIWLVYCVRHLTHALSPSGAKHGSVTGLVDRVFRAKYLAQGPRIVAIGGGTGLSTMLRGLKNYTANIVAIVTVTDDGGSSGKLHRLLNIPPPGDIRNCLVALADAEGTMTELLQYRFRGPGTGEGLRDHAVGNLLIAALTELNNGDFQKAVLQASQVLNIRGEVWPSTLEQITLVGEMEDGSILHGETTIAHSPLRIKRIRLNPEDVSAPPEVIEAIENADIIVIGPGSVYTSIIPNLLVRGIPEALNRARAPRVYVCNVMTQPGESDRYSASDHVQAVVGHVPVKIVDYVLLNTDVPSPALLDKYGLSGSGLVTADTDRIRKLGFKPLPGSFISGTDVVRHDPTKLAEAIMRLLS